MSIKSGRRLVGQFKLVHDGKSGTDKWQVTIVDRGEKVILQPLREQEDLITKDDSKWLVVVGDSRFVSRDEKFRIHAVILVARKPSQRMVFCQTETPDGGTEWSHVERRNGRMVKTIISHAATAGPSVEEPAWHVDLDVQPRVNKGNFMLFVARPVRPAEDQPKMQDGVFQKGKNPADGSDSWEIKTSDGFGVTYVDVVSRESIKPTNGRSWRYTLDKVISRARNGKRVVTLVRLVGPTPVQKRPEGLADGIENPAKPEPKVKPAKPKAKPMSKDALSSEELREQLQMSGALIVEAA